MFQSTFPFTTLFNVHNNFVLAHQTPFPWLSIRKVNLADREVANIRNQIM